MPTNYERFQQEYARINGAKADIAAAITAKGVTVPSSTTLDGYADLISAISAGSGWLPASAELVASASETINLSSGTDWDTWTPTTTNTSIAAAGTTRAACSYKITTDYQDTALIGICAFRTVYSYTGSVAKGYQKEKLICGIANYAPIKPLDYSSDYYGVTNAGTNGFMTYYTSASAFSLYVSTSYGVSPTGISWGTSSATSTSARTVGFTRPAIYARCNTTYFTTTAAEKINSSSTNIYCYYKIYKIDKTESPLYGAFDSEHGVFFSA